MVWRCETVCVQFWCVVAGCTMVNKWGKNITGQPVQLRVTEKWPLKVVCACVCVVDSSAHFEVPGFRSTTSIPPICDIPLTEVNCKLYGQQYWADSLHLDWFDCMYLFVNLRLSCGQMDRISGANMYNMCFVMNCKGWANEKPHVFQYRTIKKNFLSNLCQMWGCFNRFSLFLSLRIGIFSPQFNRGYNKTQLINKE